MLAARRPACRLWLAPSSRPQRLCSSHARGAQNRNSAYVECLWLQDSGPARAICSTSTELQATATLIRRTRLGSARSSRSCGCQPNVVVNKPGRGSAACLLRQCCQSNANRFPREVKWLWSGMEGCELLQHLHRPEPPHSPLSSSERQVAVSTGCWPSAAPLTFGVTQFAHRSTIAAQTVAGDRLR